MQAGKNAEHLEVALQAHPFEITIKRGEIRSDRQPLAFCLLPVASGPVQDAWLLPADERITGERDEVVGYGAVDRVLKIDHARVGVCDHEIAGHVVAVHIDSGLSHVACDDEPHRVGQRLPLFRGERDMQVARDVPLGK